MNIKQYMREGRKAEDVLFGEGDETNNASLQHYDELPLPVNHVIRYSNDSGDATYTVKKVISEEGSCSITYLVQGALDDYKVLKEFCPKSIGLRRYMIKDAQGRSAKVSKKVKDQKVQVYHDYQLNYDRKDKTISTAWNKFKEEPGRVRDLLDMNSQDWETSARKMHLPVPYGKSFKLYGNWYYLLEVVEGDTLFDYVSTKDSNISWAQKVSIMQQLCIALNNLHKGSVHMDVSPFNILVKKNEADGSIHLTLIDFGLATSIIHQPGFSSLHGEGTDVFTDTKSWLERYKILHGINKEPAPILVVDIFSIGMIWLYLLYADQFHNCKKVEMKERLENLKFNIGANIETADTEWMKDALQLADDSISYDDTRQTDADIGLDDYGPFHKRPKTAEEWFRRLDDIDNQKTQSEKPSVTVNSDTPLQMPAYNDKKVVELTFYTNGNWEASCDAVWLNGWKPQGEAGKHTFQLTAKPNMGIQLRDTTITITTKVGEAKDTKVVKIEQPGCGIVLQDGQSFEFLAKGEKKLFKFKTGSTYTYSWKKNESNWLKSEELEQQDGWHVFQLVAEENKTKDSQEAVLEINCCGNLKEVPFTQLKILQVPKIDLLTETPLEFPANDSDRTVELEFTTNGNWKASCDAVWLNGWKPKGEAGKHTFQLTAKPNIDIQLRDTTITITTKVGEAKDTKVVKIEQPGCGIVLQDGQSFKFLAEGEKKLLKFKTGSDYSFSCNSDWLKSEEIEEQDGWHVINLEAQPNDSTIDRYAEVHINCRGNEKILQYCQEKVISEPIHEVKIKDGQQTCFSAEGGNYDLEIEATGSWTAKFEGSPEWIKMRKNYGTDNGKLQLHVNKNTSTFNKDKVKLSITLNDGKAQDFVFLSQEGRIDNPFDWKAFWQKVRISTYVLSAVFLVGGLYALWEWQKPVLEVHEELHKTLAPNVTSTGWDFNAKDTWTAEVEDGTWAFIPQRTGESGTNRLNVEFKENSEWAVREATIRLTCQDKSELLTIRQLYSRVDSLNYVLSEYRKQCDKGDKSGFNEIHMRLDRSDYRGVFRLKDGSYIGNNTYIIQGENKDCRIGDTHKVVGFKQNADSLFTEIIVAPINE